MMGANIAKERAVSEQREQFIEQNLMLVHSLAHRYTGKGIEYDDLYAAGCLGLIKAYDGFDEQRGFSFSTYAVPVILGEIKRLFRDGGSIKVSRSLKDLSMKIARERSRLEHKLMRTPTVNELATALGVSPEEIAESSNSSLPPISLTMDNDDDEHIKDIPADFSEEEMVGRIALIQAMGKLNDDERTLIHLRYFCDMTQSDAAKRLNITQVAVSRKEKAILLKLRKQLS